MNEVLCGKKKSEVLAEAISQLNYGDIIRHGKISDIIEVEYPSHKYSSEVNKARKILKDNGIFLESIHGDGYRVIDPDDVVNHSLKHYKRGFNEMKKGYETLEKAPTEHMTPEGRAVYRRVHDRAVTLNAAMKGASVELKTLGRKKHPMDIGNMKNN